MRYSILEQGEVERCEEVTSDSLSLAAAILALPSVIAIGLVLLTESWGNPGIKLPNLLLRVRNRMAQNRGKWNRVEFYMRIGGFIGALSAIGLQIAALSIRIWEVQP